MAAGALWTRSNAHGAIAAGDTFTSSLDEKADLRFGTEIGLHHARGEVRRDSYQ
jgi:hypothetical protein